MDPVNLKIAQFGSIGKEVCMMCWSRKSLKKCDGCHSERILYCSQRCHSYGWRRHVEANYGYGCDKRLECVPTLTGRDGEVVKHETVEMEFLCDPKKRVEMYGEEINKTRAIAVADDHRDRFLNNLK